MIKRIIKRWNSSFMKRFRLLLQRIFLFVLISKLFTYWCFAFCGGFQLRQELSLTTTATAAGREQRKVFARCIFHWTSLRASKALKDEKNSSRSSSSSSSFHSLLLLLMFQSSPFDPIRVVSLFIRRRSWWDKQFCIRNPLFIPSTHPVSNVLCTIEWPFLTSQPWMSIREIVVLH